MLRSTLKTVLVWEIVYHICTQSNKFKLYPYLLLLETATETPKYAPGDEVKNSKDVHNLNIVVNIHLF